MLFSRRFPRGAPVSREAFVPPVHHVVVGAGSATGGSGRCRSVGRICGGAPIDVDSRSRRMLDVLGPGAQALGFPDRTSGPGSLALVADWDGCEIRGRAITSLESWREIVREGRLSEVTGAFVLAWREPDGTVGLARDAIGERTLFHASPHEGAFLFASSIRALLASGLVTRNLDRRSVAAYLTYAYVPGESTLVDGVSELLPGEVLRWRGGEAVRSTSWRIPPEDADTADVDTLRKELRSALETAVLRRLPRGEPVGASLSGGLDSSLVVALARKLHDAPVLTFSVSFGPGYANELPFSSLVADHCGTRHRVVEISPEAVVAHLDESIALLSDPIGDPLTVPNALVFQEASRHVGVVLNGEGGDPCFGGPKNLPMLLAQLLGDGADDPSAVFARERTYLRSHQKCFDDLGEMLEPGVLDILREDPLESSLAPRFSDPRWRNFVTKLQAANVALKGAHHILPKVDAESFPAGVLARSPLFDRDVVEVAFRIPPQLKLYGSVEKFLLKETVRDLLPASILERPKSGMLVPVEAWFDGPLLEEARRRLLGGLGQWGIVRQEWLERLLARRVAGHRPRCGAKIWLLVTLESWLRGVLAEVDAPTFGP